MKVKLISMNYIFWKYTVGLLFLLTGTVILFLNTNFDLGFIYLSGNSNIFLSVIIFAIGYFYLKNKSDYIKKYNATALYKIDEGILRFKDIQFKIDEIQSITKVQKKFGTKEYDILITVFHQDSLNEKIHYKIRIREKMLTKTEIEKLLI